MHFTEKTPVGSPSARRLTRSTPAEARDLRKRDKPDAGSGSKSSPGRKKRKTDEKASPSNEIIDEDNHSSTDVDPNSDTDHVTTDD